MCVRIRASVPYTPAYRWPDEWPELCVSKTIYMRLHMENVPPMQIGIDYKKACIPPM